MAYESSFRPNAAVAFLDINNFLAQLNRSCPRDGLNILLFSAITNASARGNICVKRTSRNVIHSTLGKGYGAELTLRKFRLRQKLNFRFRFRFIWDNQLRLKSFVFIEDNGSSLHFSIWAVINPNRFTVHFSTFERLPQRFQCLLTWRADGELLNLLNGNQFSLAGDRSARGES